MENFTPVPALAGGLLIGAASVWLLAANRRIAGVSGILHGLFAQPPGDRPWRAAFIAGLIVAGFAWHALLPSAGQHLPDGARRPAGRFRHPRRRRLHQRPRGMRPRALLV